MKEFKNIFEIYGDSIRLGYNLNEKPYTELIPNAKIYNYSANGASIYDFVEMAFRINDYNERIAIIGCGVNDLIMGRKPEAVCDRIFALVKRLTFLKRKVIVESLLPVKKDYFLMLSSFSEEEINEKIKQTNEILKGNAKKYSYLFLEYDFNNNELSTDDGVHPNSFGNKELFLQLNGFLDSVLNDI